MNRYIFLCKRLIFNYNENTSILIVYSCRKGTKIRHKYIIVELNYLS